MGICYYNTRLERQGKTYYESLRKLLNLSKKVLKSS